MTSTQQPLLDIRHRPNGDVVIKRYPFETVFNKDEWEELSGYCSSRPHSSAPEIKRTSELPAIIPPLPIGDTKDLKVWKEYWIQHDAAIARAATLAENKRVLESITGFIGAYRQVIDEHYFVSIISLENHLEYLQREPQ